jgi:signal transduction histidine kinase
VRIAHRERLVDDPRVSDQKHLHARSLAKALADDIELQARRGVVGGEPGLAGVTRSPGREVDIRVAEGLVADADPRLLRVVLENLLANAWKFTSKRADARIELDREERGGETIFVVLDNGAGFDTAQAGKLFVPFQRLHTEREFEGAGVGLATVARIVARHGGRVWAESGQGATFRFTLSGA